MTIQETTRRIREEHAKVEELADRLREWVAVVPRANIASWITEARERFEHFRAHMTQHMALEERDGYMSAVVRQRPSLSVEVDRLKHEHQEIERIMASVRRAVGALESDDRLLVRDCCHRIENLLSYVEHHENDENLLLTYAFTHDIGTKD